MVAEGSKLVRILGILRLFGPYCQMAKGQRNGVDASFLAAGGGFLLAVIWMDLMFDVLSLRPRDERACLPEESLAQIAGYYRRVTTTAWPMNLLISVVMTAMVVTLVTQLVRGDRMLAGASLALCGVPIGLALTRVFPNAVRLGARTDDAAVQSSLARSICIDHLVCFGAILAFVVLRLAAR
jgi:hypothetical protein